MNDRTVEALVLLNATESRIRTLWQYREWFRTHLGWIPQEQVDVNAELRYLVKLLRTARQLAAPAIERADPMTRAGYALERAMDDIVAAAGLVDPGDHYVGMPS